ncbi:MAG: hypothetical protein ABWU16_08605, partial [Halothiobacillaceae bacterium]
VPWQPAQVCAIISPDGPAKAKPPIIEPAKTRPSVIVLNDIQYPVLSGFLMDPSMDAHSFNLRRPHGSSL